MSKQQALVVPVTVDALMVNDAVNGQIPFEVQAFNFHNLKFVESPEPAPFSPGTGADGRKLGIHLYWQLPPGLTHGSYGVNRRVYPKLPNRWLVQRSGPSGARAWVVESDYLGSDGSSTFLKPAAVAEAEGGESFDTTGLDACLTLIGRKRDLQDWSEPDAKKALFLDALGPGDLTFTAYQPYVEDVLSIYDDMGDGNGGTLPAGRYSYYVVGWYSNETGDPLNPGCSFATDLGLDSGAAEGPDRFQALLQRLGLEVKDVGANWAERSLFQGAISSVNWQPDAASPPASKMPPPYQRVNVADGKTPPVDVAVGNTTSDALSALLKDTASEQEQWRPYLLEAFRRQKLPLLDETDGDAQLQIAVERSTFGSHAGGVRWTIARTEQAAAAGAAQLTKTQKLWLADLNTHQRQLDQYKRTLVGLQQQLYELWWKQQRAAALAADSFALDSGYPVGCSSQAFATAMEALKTKVRNAIDNVKTAAAQVPTGTDSDALRAAIAAKQDEPGSPIKDAGLKLKAEPLESFCEPVDPVVLISGAGSTESIDGGSVMCRFSADATAVRLTLADQAPPITSADLPEDYRDALPSAQSSGFPTEARGLLCACYLLDQSNDQALANSAAGASGSATPDAVNQARAAVLEDWPGIIRTWDEQPWRPLFLEWELEYFPFDATGPDETGATGQAAGWSYATDLGNWRFDGTDFSWNGTLSPDPAPTMPASMLLRGRSPLTPQNQFVLKQRLKEYIANAGPDVDDAVALQAAIVKLDDWDMLSQRLGGLHEQLACRDIDMHLKPGGDVLELVQATGGYGEAPQLLTPSPGQSERRAFGGFPTASFQQIRAGQFYVRRMNLLDRFGQVANLVGPADSTQDFTKFKPYRGASLTPGNKTLFDDASMVERLSPKEKDKTHLLNPDNLLELRPRFLQPARLEFEFVDALNRDNPIAEGDGASPVAGWVLADHLNGALALYHPDGGPLGKLMLLAQAGGTRAVGWRPFPNGCASLDDFKDQLPVLYGFAKELKAQTPDSFQTMLTSIDESLWSCEPGGWGDERLSLVIGRPLALLTAQLSLARFGSPPRDPSWAYTFAGRNIGNDEPQGSGSTPQGMPTSPGYDPYDIDGGFVGGGSGGDFGGDSGSDFGGDSGGDFGGDFGSDSGGDFGSDSYPDGSGAGASSDSITVRQPPGNQVGGYAFPVRIGNAQVRQEGTIGYFIGSDFAQFHAEHAPAGQDYVKAGDDPAYPTLTPDGDPLKLCLLADPRGDLQFTTGVLPILGVSVPERFVKAPLEGLRMSFATGPVLAPTPSAAAPQLQMPMPMLDRRSNGSEGLHVNSAATDAGSSKAADAAPALTRWTWLERDDGQYRSSPLGPAGTKAVMPGPALSLRDGYLQLDLGEDS